MLPQRTLWRVESVYDNALPESVLKHHKQLNRASLPSVEPIK